MAAVIPAKSRREPPDAKQFWALDLRRAGAGPQAWRRAFHTLVDPEIPILVLPSACAVPASKVLAQLLKERWQPAAGCVETQDQRLCCQPVPRKTNRVLDQVVGGQVWVRGIAVAKARGCELDLRLAIPATPPKGDGSAVLRHMQHGEMVGHGSLPAGIQNL